MDRRSANPLLRKLELFETLSDAERQAVVAASDVRVRDFDPHEDILRLGDVAGDIILVLSGWACRCKELQNGRRQVLAYLLPGDLCDRNIFVLPKMDHAIAAVTPVRVAQIPRKTIVELVDNGPRLARAFWRSAMVAEAIEREWIVNLGQRTAVERVGHLFCELFLRLEAVGLTQGESFELPLTQNELADSVGLSTVHMNRTLQVLRARELIALKQRTLSILDIDRLKRASLFSSSYLDCARHETGLLEPR